MIINNATLTALRVSFNLSFTMGLGKAPRVTDPFVTPVPASTKVETFGFLGDFPIFKKWVGPKQIKALEERAYSITVDDYEVTVAVHKNKIKDDNLGLYPSMLEGIGQDAGYLRDRLCLDALKAGHTSTGYDGQFFFDSDHVINGVTFSNINTAGTVEPWYLMDLSKPLKPIIYVDREKPNFVSNVNANGQNDHLFNLGEYLFGGEARGAAGYSYWQTSYRSTATLNAANYEAAKQIMSSYTDDNGEKLGIVPTHIVVGTSNLAAAQKLFEAQNLAGGESNIYWKKLIIIDASSRLP
ncbi:mu-like prophage major head subunit gpT family protein [Asticcacaulis biprosthecium C19]|uniref:Mu-like prophage major head subunit gpT family protein n=1 Tax=Asticcacaulis biprosthecium C19 TaxID=715226 RepID=F4QGA1_9CAUL|nr:Mu-like prophage major head subunit gpT family protein [Asticcacaulis biprosthecium]EGF92429.1 mu-like prophage major head subunit gpT family protein [Asticcacaulis biprosthecium C19]